MSARNKYTSYKIVTLIRKILSKQKDNSEEHILFNENNAVLDDKKLSHSKQNRNLEHIPQHRNANKHAKEEPEEEEVDLKNDSGKKENIMGIFKIRQNRS